MTESEQMTSFEATDLLFDLFEMYFSFHVKIWLPEPYCTLGKSVDIIKRMDRVIWQSRAVFGPSS